MLQKDFENEFKPINFLVKFIKNFDKQKKKNFDKHINLRPTVV